MDGELRQDHRPRYAVRQAVVAIVAALLAIGAIAAVSNDEDAPRTAASPGTTLDQTAVDETTIDETTIGETAVDETAVDETTIDETTEVLAAAPVTPAPTPTPATDTLATPSSNDPGTGVPTPTGDVDVLPAGVPSIDATAYAVFDVTSGEWLAEKGADTPLAVGSVMKLLTSYVVLQSGDLTKTVTVPKLEVDISESAIGLYEGEQLPRDVLLRAMLIVSANDAARALAVDVGGSTEGFVAQMNAAADQLGLSNTVAANPIGLDATGAHSSARDMIELAAVLLRDETFREAVAKQTASLHGQTFAATNKLLTTYEGATGVKTGRTTQAGYCLVGSATRDGRSIIVSVMGAPTEADRLSGATALLDWAFST